MAESPTEHAAPKARPDRRRSALVGLIGVVAVLGVVFSVVAVWARAVLFDSDKVAAVVSDALADPQVNDALALRITEAVVEAAGVDAYVDGVLPDALLPLRPALVGGIETVVQRQVGRLLQRDESQALITSAVRRSHAGAMRLLQGDGLVDGINVDDGEVSLNLLPLVGRAMEAVQRVGLFTAIEVPELTLDGDPAAQIVALESALGRDLADDFGQLVVFRSETLAEAQGMISVAQTTMALVKRGVAVILLLTIGLLAATIVLAQQRRRAVLVLALGVTAALLVTRRVVQQIVDESPDLVVNPDSRAAVSSLVKGLTSGLLFAVTLLLIVGIVLAAMAYLTGSGSGAVRVRRRIGLRDGSPIEVVTAHREAVAIAAYGIAVVCLVVFSISPVGVTVAAVFGLFGVWVQSLRPSVGSEA